jgi:hypothetical protein
MMSPWHCSWVEGSVDRPSGRAASGALHAWVDGGWRPVDDVTPRRRNYLFLGREAGRAAGAACSATSAA